MLQLSAIDETDKPATDIDSAPIKKPPTLDTAGSYLELTVTTPARGTATPTKLKPYHTRTLSRPRATSTGNATPNTQLTRLDDTITTDEKHHTPTGSPQPNIATPTQPFPKPFALPATVIDIHPKSVDAIDEPITQQQHFFSFKTFILSSILLAWDGSLAALIYYLCTIQENLEYGPLIATSAFAIGVGDFWLIRAINETISDVLNYLLDTFMPELVVAFSWATQTYLGDWNSRNAILFADISSSLVAGYYISERSKTLALFAKTYLCQTTEVTTAHDTNAAVQNENYWSAVMRRIYKEYDRSYILISLLEVAIGAGLITIGNSGNNIFGDTTFNVPSILTNDIGEMLVACPFGQLLEKFIPNSIVASRYVIPFTFFSLAVPGYNLGNKIRIGLLGTMIGIDNAAKLRHTLLQYQHNASDEAQLIQHLETFKPVLREAKSNTETRENKPTRNILQILYNREHIPISNLFRYGLQIPFIGYIGLSILSDPFSIALRTCTGLGSFLIIYNIARAVNYTPAEAYRHHTNPNKSLKAHVSFFIDYLFNKNTLLFVALYAYILHLWKHLASSDDPDTKTFAQVVMTTLLYIMACIIWAMKRAENFRVPYLGENIFNKMRQTLEENKSILIDNILNQEGNTHTAEQLQQLDLDAIINLTVNSLQADGIMAIQKKLKPIKLTAAQQFHLSDLTKTVDLSANLMSIGVAKKTTPSAGLASHTRFLSANSTPKESETIHKQKPQPIFLKTITEKTLHHSIITAGFASATLSNDTFAAWKVPALNS